MVSDVVYLNSCGEALKETETLMLKVTQLKPVIYFKSFFQFLAYSEMFIFHYINI